MWMLGIGVASLMAADPLPETKPNQTVITSEQFRLDMGKHQGVFSGNVLISSTNFKMRAPEMTVIFGETDNRIEKLIAKGGVEIEQPDRTAKANQVDYTVSDDKILLSGSPEVLQGKNKITGTTIAIYRKDNRMDIEGRSRVLIFDDLSSKKSDK
jgi:lipopolysaccharide export system protein LptA